MASSAENRSHRKLGERARQYQSRRVRVYRKIKKVLNFLFEWETPLDKINGLYEDGQDEPPSRSARQERIDEVRSKTKWTWR